MSGLQVFISSSMRACAKTVSWKVTLPVTPLCTSRYVATYSSGFPCPIVVEVVIGFLEGVQVVLSFNKESLCERRFNNSA